MICRTVVEYCDQAAVISDQLKQYLSIDFKLKPMESNAGFDAYDAGDFIIAPQGSTVNLNDPDAGFRRFVPGTLSRWAGGGKAGEEFVVPGLLDLFNQQTRESDEGKRLELVRQMEQLLIEDNAYIGLYWSLRSWAVFDRVKNFRAHPSIYAHLMHEHLYCDPECRVE